MILSTEPETIPLFSRFEGKVSTDLGGYYHLFVSIGRTVAFPQLQDYSFAVTYPEEPRFGLHDGKCVLIINNVLSEPLTS